MVSYSCTTRRGKGTPAVSQLSGEQARLAYAYSAFGGGFVELATFNAEVTKGEESGTVVGTPGARIRFDESEARRAIQILGSFFPAARSGDSA